MSGSMRFARPLLIVLAVSLAGCAQAVSSSLRSGIAGRVVEGPVCPVERVPPDPRCAPRPLKATLRIRALGGSGATTVVHSGSDGRFSVALPRGSYRVTAEPVGHSPFPRPPAPDQVRVSAGHVTHVTVTYDTGIR